jgi:hypothetical protein
MSTSPTFGRRRRRWPSASFTIPVVREQQLKAQAGPFRRSLSPVMSGHSYRCLEPGHPKRGCTNNKVYIRCTEEGHGSGKCKRPRSPASEDELRRIALATVARHRRAGVWHACPSTCRVSGPAPGPVATRGVAPGSSPMAVVPGRLLLPVAGPAAAVHHP